MLPDLAVVLFLFFGFVSFLLLDLPELLVAGIDDQVLKG
jgi:hypothetical protein